ncbi:MAG: DnaJ domain-containing protein [bacterium]
MHDSDYESFKDYYQLLGLGQDADEKQIKTAYRRLAHTYHPDKNPGDRMALEKFKKITEAYGVLVRDKMKDGNKHFINITQPGQSNILNILMDRLKTGFFKTVKQAKDFWDSIETGDDGIEDKRCPGLYLEITNQEAIEGTTKSITIKNKEEVRKYRIDIPSGIKDGVRLKIRDWNLKPYYLTIKILEK